MKMHSNTILITGGGSGIGMGLAETFHKAGNHVIAAGRREQNLKAVCAANPGMRYYLLDVADASSIIDLAGKVAVEFPGLNCVINNAGVQTRSFNFGGSASSFDDAAMFNEIQTNLTGLIRMCAAFIPLLRGKDGATLINVSSGLAFVPLAFMPIYCATKAAVHSFSVSLRRQLRDSGIRVIEMIPPYVKTELGGARKEPVASAIQPMPLDVYVAQAMKGLAADSDEVIAGDAIGLSSAAGLESARKLFSRMNG